MTQYVVLHQLGKLCGITVEGPDKEYSHPIETWALRDGKQLEFARMRMASALKQYHIAGHYDNMARYALSMEEMRLILKHRLGPSDRERFEYVSDPENRNHRTSHVASTVGVGIAKTILTILWRGVRFLLIMIVVAITLGKIGHKR